jgi:ArsR family transcriptional regulator
LDTQQDKNLELTGDGGELEPICRCGVDADVVESVRAELTEQTLLIKAAELFKVLGDPTRLKIINALLLSEMCVCDVAALLDMTQPAVSHHLKILRQAHLVKYRRTGKSVYYELDDEHVSDIFHTGLLHACE